MSKSIVIAIDGHSSCGKSTTAKALAEKLNYIYIDSGAMYRAVTLYCLDNDIDPQDEAAVIEALPAIKIELKRNGQGKVTTVLNGKEVESEIRSMRVSGKVSEISKIRQVREHLVHLQRKMGEQKGIVMDGRDIGTVVFPDAELKIFMTAGIEVRAERRHKELLDKGKELPFEEVKANLQKRDKIDSEREFSPLKKAEDAKVLDNSNMTPEEQLEQVLSWFYAVINKQ